MATKQKVMCEICNISMSNSNSYENHLLGSKHQLAMHTKRIREKKEKCSIFITGFLRSTKKEALEKFFSQYDKVIDSFPETIENFFIIQFENEKTVEKLLKMTIYFQGRKLLIRRRVLKNVTETKESQESLNLKIVQSINCDLPFEHQLDEFIGAVQVPLQKTINIYNQLCADIQTCLSVRFVNCRVWPFGSTVSGLGFKHSDIDVFIEVLCHPIITDDTESNLAAAYVKLAKNCLCKARHVFSHVIPVPKAKTPIVKCVHKPTGVSCDINFKNMLGVCNSRLINFILNLDARLRPTMIIIKFWAQMQELSGSGRISNYGLTMMFFFYLQQLPDSIVPPIGWLQTEHTVQFHEGWNGGFCDNIHIVKSSNKSTIPELLHGFFQFYGKYDYGFNVICPLIGESIPKAEFVITENLSNKLFHYKNMVNNNHCKPLNCTLPLCVQDPFELSHNITAMVQQRLLEHFQNVCQTTAAICSECLTQNDSKNLLTRIFKKQIIYNNAMASDDKCVFQMKMNTTLNYIDHSIIKGTVDDKSNLLRQACFEKINQFLISTLSKIFLFKVTIKKDLQKHKSQKVAGQSDVHDNNVIDSISFHCIGHHNVWDARKSIAKNFNQIENSTSNFIDREIAISDYIANELCKGIEIAEPIVDFHLELNYKINPTEAEFILKNDKSRKNCFRQMANYFTNKFALWFEKWIKETSDNKEKRTNEPNPKNIETKTISDDINIDDADNINDHL